MQIYRKSKIYLTSILSKLAMSSNSENPYNIDDNVNYYRADGVRITHDPYHPHMIEKYGAPGKTDQEGFDPYRDSVGPGIYGGRVKRDKIDGSVIIGKQYQNHNPNPGPVYLGGGYAPIVEALSDKNKLESLLKKFPDLANDITTGGAQPLHMCGMSKLKQESVEILVTHGADLEALDTYGMTPLHRMASNNLPIAGEALLKAGADPNNGGLIRETPLSIAQDSHAFDFINMIKKYSGSMTLSNKFESSNKIKSIQVMNAGVAETNGVYNAMDSHTIPLGFDKVCVENGWDSKNMWSKLNGNNQWYLHSQNNCYVYRNLNDRQWWIDGTDGLGVYIVNENRGSVKEAIPSNGWSLLTPGKYRTTPTLPTVLIFRENEL